MKLTKLFETGKPTLSFEVFPPKTTDKFESVKHATEKIANLEPDFMSVTYGAGGGTSDFTVSIARNIWQNYGVTPLAHLTCVSSTKEQIEAQLRALSESGIENIMALRGDIPGGSAFNGELELSARFGSNLLYQIPGRFLYRRCMLPGRASRVGNSAGRYPESGQKGRGWLRFSYNANVL